MTGEFIRFLVAIVLGLLTLFCLWHLSETPFRTGVKRCRKDAKKQITALRPGIILLTKEELGLVYVEGKLSSPNQLGLRKEVSFGYNTPVMFLSAKIVDLSEKDMRTYSLTDGFSVLWTLLIDEKPITIRYTPLHSELRSGMYWSPFEKIGSHEEV